MIAPHGRTLAEPAAPPLFYYRALTLLVATLVVGFGLVTHQVLPTATDPRALRFGIAVLALGLAAGSYGSGWLRRHYRTFLYGLYHLVVMWASWLCAVNDFSTLYAVGIVIILTLLGLGGGVSSTRVHAIGSVIASATLLPLLALLLNPDAELDRFF